MNYSCCLFGNITESVWIQYWILENILFYKSLLKEHKSAISLYDSYLCDGFDTPLYTGIASPFFHIVGILPIAMIALNNLVINTKNCWPAYLRRSYWILSTPGDFCNFKDITPVSTWSKENVLFRIWFSILSEILP